MNSVLFIFQILSICTTIYLFLINKMLYYLILNGVISMISVFIYLILAAPDIAITEGVIGIAISTGLFILTIIYIKYLKTLNSILDNKIIGRNLNQKIVSLIMNISFLIIFAKLFYSLPINSIFDKINIREMYDFYIKDSIMRFKFPSIVTSIVVGYRAFDTLFETIVIYTTSRVFYALFLTGKKKL